MIKRADDVDLHYAYEAPTGFDIWSHVPCGCLIVKFVCVPNLQIVPCNQHTLRICPRRVKRREIAQRREYLALARSKNPWGRR